VLLDEEVEENYNISSVGGMEWTNDGRWILFGRWHGYPTDELQLCRVSVNGGPSEAIGRPFPFASLSISPKDETIAYSTTYMGSRSGVWIFKNLLPLEMVCCPSSPKDP
jgi:hypothetical protein